MIVGEEILNGIPLSGLPVPSELALLIASECRKDESDIRAIARLVEKDISLYSRLAMIAGSVIYGGGKAMSTEHILVRIGLRMVGMLCVTLSVVSRAPIRCRFPSNEFNAYSLVSAVAARSMHKAYNVNSYDAFMAGMLSKVGRLTLAFSFPEQYSRLISAGKWPSIEDEIAMIGTDSGSASIWFVKQLSMEDDIVDMVAEVWNTGDGIISESWKIASGIIYGTDHDAGEDSIRTVMEDIRAGGWDKLMNIPDRQVRQAEFCQ